MKIVSFFFLLIYGKLTEVLYHLKSTELIGVHVHLRYSTLSQYLLIKSTIPVLQLPKHTSKHHSGISFELGQRNRVQTGQIIPYFTPSLRGKNPDWLIPDSQFFLLL